MPTATADSLAIRIFDELVQPVPLDVISRAAARRWQGLLRPVEVGAQRAAPFWLLNRPALRRGFGHVPADLAEWFATAAGRAILAADADCLVRPDVRDVPNAWLLVWNTNPAIFDKLEFPVAALPEMVADGSLIVLHAAAFSIDGRGVLLLAPSGGGKSTAARLANTHGAVGMAEDAVGLRMRHAAGAEAARAVEMAALPPFGILGNNLAAYRPDVRAPLHLVAVLRQSRTEFTAPLPRLECLKYLLIAARFARRQWRPAARANRLLDTLGELARDLPAVTLHFRRESNVPALLRPALAFGERGA